MKICGVCKQNKNDSEFSIKKKKSDGTIVLQYQCKICHSNYRKEHYRNHKSKYLKKAHIWNKHHKEEVFNFLLDYFKLHPCKDCGISNPIVLEFDHVRGKKIDNVSRMLTHSKENLEKEISKCDVVCANCHRIRTANRGNWLWVKLLEK